MVRPERRGCWWRPVLAVFGDSTPGPDGWSGAPPPPRRRKAPRPPPGNRHAEKTGVMDGNLGAGHGARGCPVAVDEVEGVGMPPAIGSYFFVERWLRLRWKPVPGRCGCASSRCNRHPSVGVDAGAGRSRGGGAEPRLRGAQRDLQRFPDVVERPVEVVMTAVEHRALLGRAASLEAALEDRGFPDARASCPASRGSLIGKATDVGGPARVAFRLRVAGIRPGSGGSRGRRGCPGAALRRSPARP